jgi:hypothetical protein
MKRSGWKTNQEILSYLALKGSLKIIQYEDSSTS